MSRTRFVVPLDSTISQGEAPTDPHTRESLYDRLRQRHRHATHHRGKARHEKARRRVQQLLTSEDTVVADLRGLRYDPRVVAQRDFIKRETRKKKREARLQRMQGNPQQALPA